MTTILDRHEDQLVLVCNNRLNDLVKSIPGYQFDYTSDAWRAPLSPLTVTATWSVFQGHVEVTAAVTEWMSDMHDYLSGLRAIANGTYRASAPASLAEDFWLPQIDGAMFLAAARYAYLCDDMGAGKTAQVLRALRYQFEELDVDPYPALVVCNNSAKHNWPGEAYRWTPGVHVSVIDGSIKQREKIIAEARESSEDGYSNVLVINWESLHTKGTGRKHTRLKAMPSLALKDNQKIEGDLNGGWLRSVIADEAHRAKGWRNVMTRALWYLGHQPEIVNRWAMTGTPLTGEYEDLWAIGHFVDPDSFPAKTRFMERYTIQSVGYHGGLETHGWNHANERELMDYFKCRFLRRTKEDMRGDAYKGKLPPVTRAVPMKGAQKKAYKDMKERMLASDGEEVFAAGSDMELHMRLGQFSAGTPVIEEVDGLMSITGLKKPSCKWDVLEEILMEAGDQQVVVFAQSKLLIKLIEEQLTDKGISFGSIHGDIGTLERQASVESFQAGNIQVMLCTYSAGSESINLNASCLMVRLQWTNNFVHWKQAPDRLDRGEQENFVTIIDVVTEGSAEHLIHQNIDEKGQLARSLDDPDFQKELLNA